MRGARLARLSRLAMLPFSVLEKLRPRVSAGGVVFVHDATDEKLQNVLQDASLVEGVHRLFVPSRSDLRCLATKTLAIIDR